MVDSTPTTPYDNCPPAATHTCDECGRTPPSDWRAKWKPGDLAIVEGRKAMLVGTPGGPVRWQWANGDWTAIPMDDPEPLPHADRSREALISELKRLQDRLALMRDESEHAKKLHAAYDQVDEARAALTQVRELHAGPFYDVGEAAGTEAWCSECGDRWPCPTIQALGDCS